MSRTQGVQPGNEEPALRSHASEEVIGVTPCGLKPQPGEQLIVALVCYHDNCRFLAVTRCACVWKTPKNLFQHSFWRTLPSSPLTLRPVQLVISILELSGQVFFFRQCVPVSPVFHVSSVTAWGCGTQHTVDENVNHLKWTKLASGCIKFTVVSAGWEERFNWVVTWCVHYNLWCVQYFTLHVQTSLTDSWHVHCMNAGHN